MTDHVRVWRLRKDHTWIVARRWPSREQALTQAESQLRDLQRAGWNTHW